MLMMLAMVAGCRDSSGDSGSAGDAPTVPLTASVNVAEPAPAEIIVAGRPLAEVDVSAQPAPLGSLDLPPSPDAAQATTFPDEVTSFMVDRDSCDHFRGEEPYDGERRVYLAENIAELCTGTDAKLAMLRRRYADNAGVIAALRGYEDHIEAPAQD
jgi:hypothetical protein